MHALGAWIPMAAHGQQGRMCMSKTKHLVMSSHFGRFDFPYGESTIVQNTTMI